MSKTLTWLLAGAALTLTAAGAAAAHDPGKERAERRAERDVRVYRFSEGDGPRAFARRFSGREDHLRDILQLRPDQEPALKAFLEATKRERGEHHVVRFHRDEDKSTLERLAEMERHMAEQQAAMRARIEATRAFYNQLDARQKKAFDAMPMMMMAGPHMGPMLIPAAMPLDVHVMPVPPVPPAPPAPPAPPPPPPPPADI